MSDWVEREMAACDLGDKRLDKRLRLLLKRLSAEPDLSIPAACKGMAETAAAYRFFDNDRVSPERMLAPHAEATLERLGACERVLLVQDTTELDFTGRQEASGLGPLNWAERVGWEKFFEKCDIPFTEHLIDDYRLQYDTYRTTSLFKYTDAAWEVSKAVGGI